MNTRSPNPAILKGIAQNVARTTGAKFEYCHQTLLALVEDGTIVTEMSGGHAIDILRTKIEAERAIANANKFVAKKKARQG